MSRNVIILALCQALAMSGTSMLIAISALVGQSLAPHPSLTTAPLAAQFIGTMVTTIPASLLMARIGRRAGFTIGQLVGVCGGATAAYGVMAGSFILVIVGTALLGVHNAFWQYYRFAAADAAPPDMKSRAISYVLAGGLVAAFVGPQLSKWTVDLAPAAFSASYMAVIVLCSMAIICLQFTRLKTPLKGGIEVKGRPILQIMKSRTFVVAAMSSTIGYAVMNMLMTSTPLAMKVCGFAFADSATVIQWHIVGMFLPSFFTGHLIKRFGVTTIIAVGAVLQAGAVALALSGVDFHNFIGGLIFLGLGWNFMFIGGSTLLTSAYNEEERAKTQAAHDFMVFTLVAISAFASGALHELIGWTAVNLISAVPVAIAFLAVIWYRLQPADDQTAKG